MFKMKVVVQYVHVVDAKKGPTLGILLVAFAVVDVDYYKISVCVIIGK